jgi:UDP-N-acetylmuramate dehydrogenase
MLDQGAKTWLRGLLGPGVRFDEPMARHTSFRIGGPADALVQPQSEEQLKAILQWTRQTQTPYLVIGGGTNLLVRDGGIRGLVIHLGRLAAQITWQLQESKVYVDAGAATPTRRICRLALQQGWRGINFALGIPGTIAGAILMNAGTAQGAMADVLEAVTIMTTAGEKVQLRRDAMAARYRDLQLPADILDGIVGPGIVLAGHLNLTLGDRATIRAHARQLMKQRSRRQPGWQPSAGCFFKNPSMDRPAGRLIDEAGLKGLRVGDAQVSDRHANFIINLGRATAEQVLALSATVQERVQNYTGVLLTPEVRIVGEEKTNP